MQMILSHIMNIEIIVTLLRDYLVQRELDPYTHTSIHQNNMEMGNVDGVNSKNADLFQG